MNALQKKLVRDLIRLRGQVLTIALVVGCGIAGYVSVVGTYRSLTVARDAYYERERFADVFADVIRAPSSIKSRVEQFPEVAVVATRIRNPARVPLDTLSEPARGEVVSVDARRPNALDAVQLATGRLPESGRSDEVAVLESFAGAHGLRVGDRLPLVLEGIRTTPRIVGIARSPDYVFPIAPGEVSFDSKKFAVVWMDERVLARALRMEGAFTHLSARLQPNASRAALLRRLDQLLLPYGGGLAVARDKHPSNALVEGELAQLQSMATTIPLIFLGVAAFLVNVVLSRLIQLDRPEIAALKAMGYRDRTLGLHYLQLVALIVWIGAALGLAFGAYFGGLLIHVYARYFSFPGLHFRLYPALYLQALGISSLAAVSGALVSARSVMRLAPAEAMRPPQPLRYRRGFLTHGLFARWLGPSAAMVTRELLRRPLRLALSSFGIAMSVAVLVVGRFSIDAIDHLVTVQFRSAQREDLAVSFSRALPMRATRELAHLPGVLRAEGVRSLAVRVRAGHAERTALLTGLSRDQELRRIVDSDARVHLPPRHGVMLTRKLAEVLGVRVGDSLQVENLERDRRTRELRVTATVDDLFGMNLYMESAALSHLLDEERSATSALLRVDASAMDDVLRRLSELPAVLGITRRAAAFELFEQQSAEQMRIMTLTLTIFAGIIAAGVVYNNARVSLSMRARDLASLRVIGFRRSEISSVLLSELTVQTLLGLAPGMLIGRWLVLSVANATDPELYRFPVLISARTYAFALAVTLGAALISALLVRRRLDRLDLIAVLKTRE